MKKEKKITYDLNLYHVNNNLSLQDYQETFKLKKGCPIHSNILETDDYSILYYTYKNQTSSDEIEWFKIWKEFFKEINEPLRRSSQTGHGVILIHLKKRNEKYAVLFGRSFTLIKENVITQFGMDMASILFDGTSIDSISSKYFSLNKNKSITSYYGDSTFDFNDNEAVDLLKANIVDYSYKNFSSFDDLLSIIKRKAIVGMNNIKISLYKDEIKLEDIINVCKYIDDIRLNYQPRFIFPKMISVNQTTSELLDNQLLENIIKNDMTNFEFSVPFYSKSSSDEFEFLNNIEEIKIKIGKIESEIISSLDTFQIFDFIKTNISGISSIRQIRVIIDDEPDYLIKWLDAQLDYNGKTYALYDGKWFEFNQSYIDNINKRVKSFENEIIKVDLIGEYEFSKQEEIQYFTDNKDNIQKSFGESTPYREYIYNYKLSKEKKYKLFDRITFDGNIEVCDLYGNNTLIHCKIGKTANLEECLRQAIYGTKYFYQNKVLVANKENHYGEKIGDANSSCVIYLSDSKNIDNFLISSKRSLRVKQTFIDWVNMCRNIKFGSKLIVSKYRNA